MRFYLLVIFILNSFILCAQTTTTSFLTNNYSLLKDQKGFDYIYALCFAKNENLAIASNYGLYQFNGATITKKYNNKKDYITFHQHGNSNWTLPFDDYIREVDHPETALPFLKNNPYKCLAAYEDKSGNSHFLINSKGLFYEGILHRDLSINTINIYRPIDFYASYLNVFVKNKQFANNLLTKILNNAENETRIIKSKYLGINNTFYCFSNNNDFTFFDGNTFGINNSTLIDICEREDKSLYLAFMGTKGGLYSWNQNTIKPLYTQQGVNAVAVDKYNHIYFAAYDNQLRMIKNLDVKCYAFTYPINRMELIKNKFYFNNDDGELFEFTTNNLNAKKIISQTQTLKKSSLSKENDHVSFINKNGIYETEENKQTKINTVLNTEINYTSIKYYANVSDYEVLVNKNIIYYSQPNKKLKPVTIPLPFNVTTSYQISSNLIELGTSTGFVGSPYFSAISI